MEIDGKYCSSLLVVDYSREQRDLIFKPLIDTNININMSILYEEQDPYKVVKDLTYNIGNTAVDLEAGKISRILTLLNILMMMQSILGNNCK